MNNEELKQQIKYLKEVERLSFRQIARQIGIGRERCSKIYSGQIEERSPRECQLERYHQLIAEWYVQHPTLRASQVFERLRARGSTIGYATVARFTRDWRKKPGRCYWSLNFEPGEEAQVDWFVVTHPILGKVAGFALILSYSRFLYARIFPRMSFEFFIEGHILAFNLLKGLPRALRYDNLKSVVLSRQPLTYNAAFLEVAHHYGFEVRLCNVRAGNEKGRVERAIRSIRETFLNTAGNHQSLRALNSALAEWLQTKNATVHRSTAKQPVLLKEEERLRPLPIGPWLNRIVHPPKQPTKTGLIIFDTNYYSVPEYLVGTNLHVHAFCEHLEIYDTAGKKVASHPRCFDRNKTFLNPLHRSFSRLCLKTKAERIYSVIKNLDPAVERFLVLNEATGEDSRQTAHSIFKLLQVHSRAVLFSALREAVTRNSPRLAFIFSLLEQPPASLQDTVHPQNKQLLTINYKPRSLEEYSS